MTPEEKALQRFTFERQRKASKSSLFTLNDNDDDEDNGSVPLTHYGQNLSDVRGALADQEDLFHKSKTSRTIPELEEVMPDADSTQRRKKTKAEVMEEVMAKSKAYKVGLQGYAGRQVCRKCILLTPAPCANSTSDSEKSTWMRRCATL